jgi:alkylhydroperoxidase/carboxymuconolactone decarboxylase family protein YurZ
VERISVIQDGLDVSRPDETTDAEIAAFRDEYRSTNKGLLDSFEFWLEFRPDVLKRHKARTRHFRSAIEPDRPLVGILAALHQYAVSGFAEGIAYEIRLAQSLGATRADVLDTLSVAFIHSGHPGMYATARYADYLREYADPEPGAGYPDGWSHDPDAFRSGMDFSTREATRQDTAALLQWYRTTLGEVPAHVEFLAAARPNLLKAYRDRYEHAIRDALPQQMLPYLLLGYNTVRGFHDGIRENVLLGRALGMTPEQLLDAICQGVLHAGIESLGIVNQAAGDLLEDME